MECFGEQVTLGKRRPGSRTVRYRHYLPELAKKPQAVRAVAPELLAELGSPFDRLWQLLVGRYGELKSARVLAQLIGAIVDHGQEAVAQTLHEVLERGPEVLSRWLLAPKPPRVTEPEALAGYQIETARAADYEELLTGGGAR